MVKNLPTVERSTKIRFGKNCTDDQGENTIVFNASNVQIDTTQPGSVYMTPVRKISDFSDQSITILTYNQATKEITDSNVTAEEVLNITLEDVIINGNVTSNTVSFNNAITSVTTLSNVGISNGAPIHTLDVGTKFYVDENDSNVLTVLGNTFVQDNVIIGGDLEVRGTLTSINTENTTIKDAIIEIGKGNVDSDMGIIMDRPGTNVGLGYREGVDEFIIAYTDSSATSSTIVPSSELIDVRVHGRLHVNSNLAVDGDTFYVDAIRDRVGINTLTPQTDFDVVGKVAISSNLTVNTNTFHVDAVNDSIGIGTVTPAANLHVEGNVYVSSNLTVDTDTFHVDTVNDRVGINTLNPTTDFHVEGNAYVSGNVEIQTDLNVTGNAYVSSNVVVTGNVDVQSELNVTGNAYVSSNVVVTGNVDVQSELNVTGNAFVSSNVVVTGNVDVLSHLNVTEDAVVTGNVNALSELNVTGNVYVSSNVNVLSDINVTGNAYAATYYGDGGLLSNVTLQVVSDHGNTTSNTIQFTNPTTALTTDLTSNVEVKLDQLNSVQISDPASDQILIYDGTDWVNEYPVHTYIKIRNALNGVNIKAGDAVYVIGTHNSNILDVGLAKSDDPSTMPCIGLSNQLLIPGQQGTAVAYGKALSVVTDTFLTGETVYVSNTIPGGLSNVKPYGPNDLIQNVGVITKVHESNGTVFVTGIGRANDVPNAQIVPDESAINYVYVNGVNNDFKKIEPSNLLTQLQTFEQVSAAGNVVSNVMEFRNVTTGLVTVANVEVGSNISVAGLSINKIPIVGAGHFLEDSFISKVDGKLIISSDVEIIGDILVGGNSYTIESNSLVINDRIIGIANNNVSHQLDIGIILQHPGKNIALVHHGEAVEGDPHDHTFTIGYTQNTLTDNHIFNDSNLITVEILGNLITQNNLIVSETLDVSGAVTFANDLTVGSNLYVDDTGSNVLHVTGNVYATRFIGDGAFLENIASNLQEITTNGNVTTNTVQFDGATALVTTGKVGIANTAPDHELSVTGNVFVSSEIRVVGGLITNLGGLTKKTYGYSDGTITASTIPEINVVFDSQLFSAKITAHLVEPTSNISVLTLDVTGGTGRDIGKGFLSIVGDQNSKHWDSDIATTPTTVTLKPSVELLSDGTYGVFVEYLGTGGVVRIDQNDVSGVTFDY